MATNTQNTPPSKRSGELAEVEPTPTPVIASTGVGGVAVYDRDVDPNRNSTLNTSSSMVDDPAPVGTSSSGSMLGWIIGAIVLILLVYFLLQLVF